VGDAVKDAGDAVGGVVGGVTGGGGSTPNPPATQAPAPPVLTYAEAKAKCIAQGVSALNVAALASCIANLRG
jgi:hypothetical protein